MSGDRHLGWEALERIRTDEASADEFAHLATCAACRDALADLERLAGRFKETLGAEADAIPAAREDAILSAARERAAAIAGKKLVRLEWWKQRSAMALAASLMVAGSAAYLTYLKRDEPPPRPIAAEAARDEAEPARAQVRTNEETRQKKEAGRLDDRPMPAQQDLQKSMPSAAPERGTKPVEPPEADAGKSKDADLAARGLPAAAPQLAPMPRTAPGGGAPVPEPAKRPATPPAALADARTGSLEEKAPAPAGSALGGAAAGAVAPAVRPSPPAPPAEGEDKLVAALSEGDGGEAAKLWLPPRTGLWTVGPSEQRDRTTPRALKLVSTEIQVRVGGTVARRVRQRFDNPSGQPIVATYSIGLAPGERSGDVSLTIGTTEVPPQPVADMTDVRVWHDLPIAGTTIDLTTLSPPRPLEGAASGSVRIRIPVPPPPPQATDEPPKLEIRLEPAQGYRIGQPSAAGLALNGHPLGSGAWDLTLPPTLGVKEDLLELDVPIVRSGD